MILKVIIERLLIKIKIFDESFVRVCMIPHRMLVAHKGILPSPNLIPMTNSIISILSHL